MAAHASPSSAAVSPAIAAATTRAITNQLKALQTDPVEGVYVETNGDNLYEWNIWIEGSAGTPYAGGIFKLSMVFPPDFPMRPPSLRFIDNFWHPNVYADGKVCISILHPPGEDEMSGERASERWLPTQTVTSVMLSVLSLLADPNTSSPANVDASVEWMRKRDSFDARVKALAAKSRSRVPPNVVIPHPDSNPREHAAQVEKIKSASRGGDEDFLVYSDPDEDDSEDDIYDFDGEEGGDDE
ncbi:ubiquitin-conjugating enzyme E2 [Pelomyxa schiedti]|nr:ubiquitin-conjugating enzyme E2 [Pelomyxa schiedti]KAH3743557.1 ubiquitin-conjugating enzyme E2 [Pelomyxa schiedti]